MIVAITGGTGFIGRKLAMRHLDRGDEVRVLSRRSIDESGLPGSVKLWTGDLMNHLDLRSFVEGTDILYHCAAENYDTNNMRATNVDGTLNLARIAGGSIRHWVQLSSVGVYGTHVDGLITEEWKIAPVNVYEESKFESEQIVMEASVKNNFSYAILRPSKVYGIGMHNTVLYQLISLLNKNAFFFIGQPGASANYIHVDDVVEAMVRCGSMPIAKNRIYNISDHRTLEEFIAIFSRELNKPYPRLRVPEAWARMLAKITAFIPKNPLTEQRVNAMVKRVIYSSERIKQELGYWRCVRAEDGLRDLVGYWRQNR